MWLSAWSCQSANRLAYDLVPRTIGVKSCWTVGVNARSGLVAGQPTKSYRTEVDHSRSQIASPSIANRSMLQIPLRPPIFPRSCRAFVMGVASGGSRLRLNSDSTYESLAPPPDPRDLRKECSLNSRINQKSRRSGQRRGFVSRVVSQGKGWRGG